MILINISASNLLYELSLLILCKKNCTQSKSLSTDSLSPRVQPINNKKSDIRNWDDCC